MIDLTDYDRAFEALMVKIAIVQKRFDRGIISGDDLPDEGIYHVRDKVETLIKSIHRIERELRGRNPEFSGSLFDLPEDWDKAVEGEPVEKHLRTIYRIYKTRDSIVREHAK